MADNQAGFYYGLWKNIAQLLVTKGVKQAVLCPGSRSAPIALSLLREKGIKCFVIGDERSAAYIALGMAQYTRKPVPVVCTSGTAALNFGPACAEAYFQGIPLLLITADRPPEWIGQSDNQAIHQENLYGKNVKASFNLPVDVSHPDAQWHTYRVVNEAVNLTVAHDPGPVHINVPLREPIYMMGKEVPKLEMNKVIEVVQPEHKLSANDLYSLNSQINFAKSIWVVAGLFPPDKELTSALLKFCSHEKVQLLADICSNQIGVKGAILNAHKFLDELPAPDLLISFGGPVVSKKLKEYLRDLKPEHWHISPSGQAADTFQSLIKVVGLNPVEFFNAMNVGGGYFIPQEKVNILREEIKSFDEGIAINVISRNLPEESILHLGNSLSVRLAHNHAAGILAKKNLEIYSNRGTSGIDGSLSSAVGTALASKKTVTIILGDMSFSYDRNALWHRYPLENLNIVVLNNGGGGIFRKMAGPASEPELEEYFTSALEVDCQAEALQWKFKYQKITSLEDLKSMDWNFSGGQFYEVVL